MTVKTQDVTLFEEGGDNSLQIDAEGDGYTKAKVWDGTNEAEVTANNRLKVEANISALPATPVEYKIVKLLNGSSPDMDVNGSSTPVEFDYTPDTDEVWYVERITFVLEDTGSPEPDDFGTISGPLSNGCLLEVQSNGNTIELANVTSNLEIVQSFANESYGDSNGILGSGASYKGSILFRNPFIIQDSTSDFIRMTIRDNITGLNFQQVSILLWREQ